MGYIFTNDHEKMIDFFILPKDEFLQFYCYLTEKDYDATVKDIIERSGYWNEFWLEDNPDRDGREIKDILFGIMATEWLSERRTKAEMTELEIKNRIDIIKNRAKKNIEEEQTARDAENRRIQALADRIRDMSDRINAIIRLANTCIENGIKIPESEMFSMREDAGKEYGYPYEFIAEGIRHHTGLIRTWPEYKKGTYEYIGINNGGACGCYDFWTDGDNVWAVHENNHKDKRTPRIKDMEKFLEEFPVFEKAFLNFIDSLA